MRAKAAPKLVVSILWPSALCGLCTGTLFSWRRDFKWLAQHLPKSAPPWQKIHSGVLNTFWSEKRVQASRHFRHAPNDKFGCRLGAHGL